jgi:hypothetical protein
MPALAVLQRPALIAAVAEGLGLVAEHVAAPANFAEQVSFANRLRRSHYLDGPNDVDWIFRNGIEAEREEKAPRRLRGERRWRRLG